MKQAATELRGHVDTSSTELLVRESTPLRISVVVRVHEGAPANLLDEALFSLATANRSLLRGGVSTNDALAIETILVVQAGNGETQADAQRLVAYQNLLEQHRRANDPPFALIQLANPDGKDLRSQALNVGIERASGRFIAFLDYDDVVYPSSYATLAGALLQGTDVLAAGGVVRAQVQATEAGLHIRQKQPWLHLGSKQADLLDNNFLPLHSFVIDRTRCQLGLPWFNAKLTRLEDYDFLLRLAAVGTFQLTHLETLVCEYRLIARHIESPGRNIDFAPTNVNPLSNRDAANLAAWSGAKRHVDRIKQDVRHAVLSQSQRAPAPKESAKLAQVTPERVWRAVRVAVEQSGGSFAMLGRVMALSRSLGVRGVLRRAAAIIQRI